MRRRCDLVRSAALAALLLAPAGAVAGAQAPEPQSGRVDEEPQRASVEEYDDARPDPPGRWAVGVFGGKLSGGTSVGTTENLFFRTSFEQDSDTLAGGRAAAWLWWRLHVEGEYARSSPGLIAVLTDLDGQGRTEAPFADLELSYWSGAVRFDLSQTRVAPFLTLGMAAVGAESSELELDESAPGLLFGGGIEVAVAGPAFLRADVRGLRSDLDLLAPGISRGVTTQLLWSVGGGIRF